MNENTSVPGHALLHSMFYDEAISVLNGVTAKDANCAMAHWGGGDVAADAG